MSMPKIKVGSPWVFKVFQSINQSFIFSPVTQQIIILNAHMWSKKKGISDKTIYVETCANSRL